MTDCSQKTWKVRTTDPVTESELLLGGGLPVSPILGRILLNRGLSTREEIDRFLDSPLQHLHDPYLLDGMKEAVARTRLALDRHEKIMVHGDYDVDGVTATALLMRIFRILKADVRSYLPHRQRDGYGMSKQAVDAAKRDGVTLIITVDCGSCANKEIEYAVSLGIDVIVTDHHEVGPTLPPAHCIVNPIKPGCSYPFKGLAGVGVAFKFAEALIKECGYDVMAFRQRFCDLAAIGTVGDIVPLLDENRILVKYGLQEIPRSGKKGIMALLNVLVANGPRGIGAGRPITSHTLAYGLAPRLNAAGRLDDASLSLQLLLTTDHGEAMELAKALESHNKHRQSEQERITNEAIEQVTSRELSKVLVLSSRGWHPGIVGIVASKVTDRFSRPSILVAVDDEGTAGVGSARSISAFNIHEALLQCGHLLQRCGGHAKAAGLSIEMAKLPEFGLAINEIAEGILTDSDLQPQLDVDVELDLDSVTSDLAYELQLLEPYGCGNPEPVFLSRRVLVLDKIRMGANKTHLRLKLSPSGFSDRPISPSPHPPLALECVAFGWGAQESAFRIGSLVDVCYNIQINHFNGQERVQMMLRDAKPSDAVISDVVTPDIA